MSFDDLQKVWQAQGEPAVPAVDPKFLLREVKRNHREFVATIYRRDVREVMVGVFLVLWFTYQGWRYHDWTAYGIAATCVFIDAFLIGDRIIQWRRLPVTNDSLKGCVEASLAQVRHQIVLLRTVFWWYLLPLTASIAFSDFWRYHHNHRLGAYLVSTALLGLVMWSVYELNQWAVRKSLEPRQRELEELAETLKP